VHAVDHGGKTGDRDVECCCTHASVLLLATALWDTLKHTMGSVAVTAGWPCGTTLCCMDLAQHSNCALHHGYG
jgi:hypothetical protein